MSDMLNDPEMREIFESFLAETNELLEDLSRDLMLLEDTPEDDDLLNRIFRGFHTIKGTASFMGFDVIAKITHEAEDVLNKLRRHELKVDQDIIDVLLEVQDWIELLVEKLSEGETPEVDYSETIDKLHKIRGTEPEEDKQTEKPKEDKQTEEPKEEDTESEGSAVDEVMEKSSEIVSKEGDFDEDDLALLDKAFDEINKDFGSKSQDEQEQEKKETSEEKEKKTEQDKNNKSSKTESKSKSDSKSKKPQKSKSVRTSESIRIDVGRVETLMDLSGELVLGRNRLAQITDNIAEEINSDSKDHLRDLIDSTAQIDFVTSEIQSAVMRMRMVPVGKLYQKAPRIVRDLSREFGKKIKLVVEGQETEIDRGIIEELNDPLVHMIRNSCDHGIEPPEERVKAGKPEQGIIKLDADQEGNNIVLKISDDGRGMNPEKLKEKSIEKGVITEEQASQMSDREAYQLIFAAGFSTAKNVSAVSGRGVGMDVVRTNIQNLKGMIDIESEEGKGSTFIIKLPLTLAIIQGLLVKADNETYAIPLSSVIEVVSIEMKNIKSISEQEVIKVRDEVIPITRLDATLHTKNIKKSLEHRYVVNVGLGLERLGLVVDELLGQQEIVIKTLGEYLGDIPGIAGSTILGDGRVIMIIDVARLIRDTFSNDYMGYPS